MLPILQFDPSSLTLWYDTHLIAKSRGSDELGAALKFAIEGNDPALRALVGGITDPWVQTRAANIAGAVWHEKRHFLDFLVTNYGALRVRQFFEFYGNLPRVLANAQQSGKLLVPIESYLNRLVRDQLEIEEPSENVLAIARAVRSRKKILEQDRKPIISRFGQMEIGGEGLFEAIAYLVQQGKIHRTFGQSFVDRTQRDTPDQEMVGRRYSWAYNVLAQAGLLHFKVLEERESAPPMVMIHEAPIIPLCYAALACRMWRQEQVATEAISSYLPNYRLASLVVALRDKKDDFLALDSVDCWAVLNRKAKDLFGRTVVEEMEIDLRHEEKYIESIRQSGTFEAVVNAYEDYHSLRTKLISELSTSPENFIDQAVWADTTAKRLSPRIVAVATAGEIGEPPPDYDRVFGYFDPDVDWRIAPNAQWWWAASPKFWPDAKAEGVIGLKDKESWHAITSQFAPTAKLCLDGRRTRTMLGPELAFAEGALAATFSAKLVIDPRFEADSPLLSMDYWRYATGYTRFRCDLTYRTLDWHEMEMIDPWLLRTHIEFTRRMLPEIETNQLNYLQFMRDWSPWIVDRGVFNRIREGNAWPVP